MHNSSCEEINNFTPLQLRDHKVNALTIDVEEYWSIFSRDWLGQDMEPTEAVVHNTDYFLQMLADNNVKATFFILGEVAKKFPFLTKRIAKEGHPIGVHGFHHRQIFKLTKEEFRQEIEDCKKLLEDVGGKEVSGHRAPAFSIMPDTKWALEVLAKAGFKYDSSVYPISGKRYGWPGFSKDICKIDLLSGRKIIEVPMSTVTVFGRTLPAAGGGYIRHFPYIVTKWAIKRIQRKRPAIVYIHPHEIDTTPWPYSTKHLSFKKRVNTWKYHKLQMRNRNSISRKITALLSEFQFGPVEQVIAQDAVSDT